MNKELVQYFQTELLTQWPRKGNAELMEAIGSLVDDYGTERQREDMESARYWFHRIQFADYKVDRIVCDPSKLAYLALWSVINNFNY